MTSREVVEHTSISWPRASGSAGAAAPPGPAPVALHQPPGNSMTAVQIHDIDPLAPGLSATERAMLMDLIKAREAYCLQGRGREYHALGKALMVVWHYMQHNAGRPDLPRTDFGSLDVTLPIDDTREAANRAHALSWNFSATRLQATESAVG